MDDDLLPPSLRARLRELRIGSRRISPLRGGGVHRSRDRGAGLEFSQYRGYEPGDEPRRIDWKLYARSDRFFVREAERDSPLTAWVLLDASASMAQADESRPQWTRLDAGKALASSSTHTVSGLSRSASRTKKRSLRAYSFQSIRRSSSPGS